VEFGQGGCMVCATAGGGGGPLPKGLPAGFSGPFWALGVKLALCCNTPARVRSPCHRIRTTASKPLAEQVLAGMRGGGVSWHWAARFTGNDRVTLHGCTTHSRTAHRRRTPRLGIPSRCCRCRTSMSSQLVHSGWPLVGSTSSPSESRPPSGRFPAAMCLLDC